MDKQWHILGMSHALSTTEWFLLDKLYLDDGKKKKESSSDVGSVSDYHRWEICRCLLTRSMFIFDIMVKLSHKEGITVTDV